jgi:hypothetical protein
MQALRIVEAFNPVDHVYARPCSAFVCMNGSNLNRLSDVPVFIETLILDFL